MLIFAHFDNLKFYHHIQRHVKVFTHQKYYAGYHAGQDQKAVPGEISKLVLLSKTGIPSLTYLGSAWYTVSCLE